MKRFTLKRMALSLATTVLFLSSQNVWAQYVPLTPLDGINAWSGGGETYESLVDEKTSSKWGCWFDPDLTDEESWP